MDIWGYCEHCDFWFECPTDHTAAWGCPSCGLEPLRIENRNGLARATDVAVLETTPSHVERHRLS